MIVYNYISKVIAISIDSSAYAACYRSVVSSSGIIYSSVVVTIFYKWISYTDNAKYVGRSKSEMSP